MKAYHTTQEHAANKLWSTFKRRDQEIFWQQYEQLLSIKARTDYKTLPSSQKEILKQYFRHSPIKYLLNTISALAGLFISFLGLVGLAACLTGTGNTALFVGFFYWNIISIIFWAPAWRFHNFSISQQYLCVHKTIFFRTYRFRWNEIHSVTFQDEIRDNKLLNTIKIKVDNRTRTFTCELAKKTREDFLLALYKVRSRNN